MYLKRENKNEGELRQKRLLRPLAAGWLLLLLTPLIMVSVVFAGATFGPVNGPEWLESGYRFTATNVTLTNPHQHVCMRYTVTPPGSLVGPFSCTNEGGGTWTCTIAQNYTDATISWQLSAHPSPSGCPSENQVLGPAGSFQTGPTAVTLAGTMANGRLHTPLLVLLSVLALALGTTGVLVWRRAERAG
jgi:hypothetical protein